MYDFIRELQSVGLVFTSVYIIYEIDSGNAKIVKWISKKEDCFLWMYLVKCREVGGFVFLTTWFIYLCV